MTNTDFSQSFNPFYQKSTAENQTMFWFFFQNGDAYCLGLCQRKTQRWQKLRHIQLSQLYCHRFDYAIASEMKSSVQTSQVDNLSPPKECRNTKWVPKTISLQIAKALNKS